MSFATAQEILDFAKLLNPNLTIDDIPDSLVTLANARVQAELYKRYIVDDIPAGSKCYILLKQATMVWAMEFLSNAGKVRWSTGDLDNLWQGNFRISYQRWQPLFFFAQGDSDKFNNLLPHATWRMQALKFIDAFVACYMSTNLVAPVSMFRDRYRRGRGREDPYEYCLEG